MNRAHIVWYSKEQNTAKSSAFSGDFNAMKACEESIVGLSFKLRIFRIPYYTPVDFLCDNQGVVNNPSKLESNVNEKHSFVAYNATICWQ